MIKYKIIYDNKTEKIAGTRVKIRRQRRTEDIHTITSTVGSYIQVSSALGSCPVALDMVPVYQTQFMIMFFGSKMSSNRRKRNNDINISIRTPKQCLGRRNKCILANVFGRR